MIRLFKYIIFTFLLFTFSFGSRAGNYVLIPMDESQKDHLKAYGIAYWVLKNEVEKSSDFHVSFEDRIVISERYDGFYDLRSQRGHRLRSSSRARPETSPGRTRLKLPVLRVWTGLR